MSKNNIELAEGVEPAQAQVLEALFKGMNFSACSKNWTRKEMKIRCKSIKSWMVGTIDAYGNLQKEILHDIIHIRFQRLTFLNVWGNYIQTVEEICRLDAPQLKKIWIWRNKIVNMRSLRKMVNSPCLDHIDMKECPLVDQSYVSELPPVPSYDRLHVNILAPKNYLAKLNGPIHDFNLDFGYEQGGAFKRIIVPKLDEALKRREPQKKDQNQILGFEEGDSGSGNDEEDID